MGLALVVLRNRTQQHLKKNIEPKNKKKIYFSMFDVGKQVSKVNINTRNV